MVKWWRGREYLDRINCRDPEERGNLISSRNGKAGVVLRAFMHVFNTFLLSACCGPGQHRRRVGRSQEGGHRALSCPHLPQIFSNSSSLCPSILFVLFLFLILWLQISFNLDSLLPRGGQFVSDPLQQRPAELGVRAEVLPSRRDGCLMPVKFPCSLFFFCCC